MNIRRIATMTVFLLTLVGGSLWASEPVVKATIPFDFVVADTALPHGVYTVEPLMDSDKVAWVLRSLDGRTSVDFLTNDAETRQPVKKSSLEFNDVGGKHFLSQIWIAGDPSGRELSPARQERMMMQKGMKAKKNMVHCERAASKRG